jgi:hypothetical protein
MSKKTDIPEPAIRGEVVATAPDVFRVRGGKTLVRHVDFRKRCNKRPAVISVRFGAGNKALATTFSVEGKNTFASQYKRAIDAMADFHGIPADSPVRQQMEATGGDFLLHYGLMVRMVTVTHEALVDAEPDTGTSLPDLSEPAVQTQYPVMSVAEARLYRSAQFSSAAHGMQQTLPHSIVRIAFFYEAHNAFYNRSECVFLCYLNEDNASFIGTYFQNGLTAFKE